MGLINVGGKGTVVPVKEGDKIDLGDRVLEIIDIPGHTPGSIAILDINNRVLISGDSVQDGHIFMFGQFRNIDAYVPSMQKLLTYKERFDEIYPSHGTLPVKPSIIEELIDAAEEIRSGSAVPEEVDMFGNKVKLYKFPCAGFLCG